MPQRKLRKRVNGPLSPEDKERHRVIRQQIEAEKPRLREIGLAAKRNFDAQQPRLTQAVAALKAAREQMGLSLSEVGARTGIDKSNLSRLENDAEPNPTIDTLTRYASAVGKEIVIVLADKLPS
jgi:DNA-binding XRE family transcriptional regulator